MGASSTRVAAAEARTTASRSLTLVAVENLNLGCASESNLKKRTENDLLAFFPHFCNQGLPRIYDTGESVIYVMVANRSIDLESALPDFDVLVRSEFLEDVFSGMAHRTQTMEDGFVEAADGCEFGEDLMSETMSPSRR